MPSSTYIDLEQSERLFDVSKALASKYRIEIFKLLNSQSLNVNEIAEKLDIPASTAAYNIKILEDAGLIFTELQPGVRGSMKLCSRNIDKIEISLTSKDATDHLNQMHYNMPIGAFNDCNVCPSCGIISEKGYIDVNDNPKSFYNIDKINAQLIWFYKGSVEYRFPNLAIMETEVKHIAISMELCSEAPYYRSNWPSDISVWINNVELEPWTCPGDFGGRRGKFNPDWWPDKDTQYGLLKTWSVTENGAFIDEQLLCNVCIDDLKLQEQDYISVRIGVKDNAKNIGGINIFGEKFGDFQQNILMRLDYTRKL